MEKYYWRGAGGWGGQYDASLRWWAHVPSSKCMYGGDTEANMLFWVWPCYVEFWVSAFRNFSLGMGMQYGVLSGWSWRCITLMSWSSLASIRFLCPLAAHDVIWGNFLSVGGWERCYSCLKLEAILYSRTQWFLHFLFVVLVCGLCQFLNGWPLKAGHLGFSWDRKFVAHISLRFSPDEWKCISYM